MLNPNVGLYVDSAIVFRVAVHGNQGLWHVHVAGAIEWQSGPVRFLLPIVSDPERGVRS
jgi:hypothetical protein